MKQTEELILNVLCSYMHDHPCNIKVDHFTNNQWEELYHLAEIHSILPIVYDVLKDNPSFLMNEPELKTKWLQASMGFVIKQIQYTSAFLDIYNAIINQGIPCIVTKGIILREMYAKKEYRVSGDEDIIIKKEDYHTVCQIFLDHQFYTENEIYDDYIQVTTFIDPATKLHIEMHVVLFGKDGFFKNLNSYFSSIFNESKIIQIEGFFIQVMNENDQLLYLICHCFKHFINNGVGLRQIMDIAMYSKLHYDKIDWHRLYAKMKKINGSDFMQCIYSISNDYLDVTFSQINFPNELIHKIDYQDFLTDIFDSGVFGNHDDKHIYSNLVVRRILNDKEKKSSIFSLLFPSAKTLRSGYPILYKKPYLLPYIWVKRALYFNKRYHQSSKNKDFSMKESMVLGNKRVELLKKYGVIKH